MWGPIFSVKSGPVPGFHREVGLEYSVTPAKKDVYPTIFFQKKFQHTSLDSLAEKVRVCGICLQVLCL